MNIKWAGNKINEDANHRLVTDTEKQTWNGKANANHTHTKSQISDFPESLKNPYNFVIQLNGGSTEGTNMFTYDGSGAKTINITPSGIGAAAASHTHTELTNISKHIVFNSASPDANKLTFGNNILNYVTGESCGDMKAGFTYTKDACTLYTKKLTISNGTIAEGTGEIYIDYTRSSGGIISSNGVSNAIESSYPLYITAGGVEYTYKNTAPTEDASASNNINLDNTYLKLSGGSVSGNILPTENYTYYNLGSTDYKWYHVYANGLVSTYIDANYVNTDQICFLTNSTDAIMKFSPAMYASNYPHTCNVLGELVIDAKLQAGVTTLKEENYTNDLFSMSIQYPYLTDTSIPYGVKLTYNANVKESSLDVYFKKYMHDNSSSNIQMYSIKEDGIYLSKPILPDANGTATLGTIDNVWSGIYSQNIVLSQSAEDNTDVTFETHKLNSTSTTDDYVGASYNGYIDDGVEAVYAIFYDSHVNGNSYYYDFINASNAALQIGGQVKANDKWTGNYVDIWLNGNVIPANGAKNFGNSNSRWEAIYGNTVSASRVSTNTITSASDKVTFNKPTNLITGGTTDIGEGATLQTGTLYCVYE